MGRGYSDHEFRPTAGVDEAGRGPLAGPVVAAAVILAPASEPAGLADSKRLSAAERERLAIEIRATSLAWAVAWADRAEIDTLNILHATLLAMRRAVFGLAVVPATVLVDGNRAPRLECYGRRPDVRTIVRGDASVPAISAASILAKVARDAMMHASDRLYPGYGFGQHKGYGTRLHRDRLKEHGPCDLHRRSFAPVRAMAER